MAPAQAKGTAVDKRADIWAFGAVLYEMFVGRAAVAGDTATDTIAARWLEKTSPNRPVTSQLRYSGRGLEGSTPS